MTQEKLRNIYFALRHGESRANVAQIILSDVEEGKKDDYTLTERGEAQVRDSALRARRDGMIGIDAIIYCSPLSRTVRTAEIAREALGAECETVIDNRLRERGFGDWERTHNSNYQKVWDDDKTNPHHTIAGVESAADVQRRVWELIEDLERRHNDRTILLVSHGDALQLLQTAFENVSPSVHRSLPHLATAEIRRLN